MNVRRELVSDGTTVEFVKISDILKLFEVYENYTTYA